MDILNFVQAHSVCISATILLISYVFIALEKIPKATVALLGAVVTILLGLLSQTKYIDGNVNNLYFINYIDFNVIFLLVSMMIIVSIATKSGMFNWVANELLKHTKGKPIHILFVLGLFTAITSAFLDNVTTVILIMPITFYIAKKLDINPIPYLITEVFASNIGGTATLIGDPPNIIIGSAAGLSFMDFVKELTGIVFVILIVVLTLLAIFFKKQLVTTEEKMASIAEIDNSHTITNKALLIRSLIVLIAVIAGFILHDITHIETSVTAMLGASILLIFEKPTDLFKEVEWNTIFFFIGLFIIIGGLEASGGIALMAKWILTVTQGSEKATALLILWGSGLISGVIDNIPYTATMTPMILEIEKVMGQAYAEPLWWCLSLGACLGGNMTIIGAAANVIVSETAAAHKHPITFMRFMKYGVVVMVTSLVLSSIYIYLRFLI
ncbi:TPA: ArsB/NhaD family transporter [Candidatus Scatousia excrementigallinarum]|mgnify:FL=1|uniref:ArsB/NhaD family transporter n=1 Tax=Candidatus Scatousia excrementigallinarum TaxID=2840935 RepID=A0A9D1EXW3_9BACT|nr:ArsB/NhaD family transporter [Candidatus Scatousia excrementigallinarum]